VTNLVRRSFVIRGACACLALAGCAIGDGTAPTSLSGSLRIADYSALANVGGVALVSLSGSPVAIVRTGDSTFLALSRICPHQGATINVAGSGFQCPRHGAQFTLAGAWAGGQRTSNLRSYATSYDAATGMLTIG
jgi:cytochrome b6-f complex iron-sulfur subunit